MELILAAAGVVALIVLLKFGSLVRVVRGLRLRRGECALREASELPGYFAELRPPLEAEMGRLGFCFSHAQLDESPFVGPVSRKWVLVYTNAAGASHAEAALTDIPEPARVFAVTFVSHFSDGYRLMTTSGATHGIIGTLPRTLLEDPYTEDLARQWEVHRTALAARQGRGSPVTLSPADYARRATELQREYISSLMRQDWVDAVGGGLFRVRFAAALRVASRLMRGEGKLKALLERSRKRHRGEKRQPLSIPIEVEIESFRRITHLRQGHGMGWAGKLALLAATMVLFAVSFGIGNSWQTALIITGVILLHEGGHYLGMRLFNYRDVKVLFLPFMGAVTVGREQRTPPHQRIVVFLLGPVPGIVVGTALLLSPLLTIGWLRETAMLLLAINYLNLLPVMPFDGGQIFNVFFARLPLVRALFQAACGLALLAASTALGKDRVLYFLGLMILVGGVGLLRYRGLVNGLARRLPRQEGALSDEALLPLIFGLLREGSHRDKPFKEKFQTATYLLQNVPAAAPSLRLALGASFAYVAVFILPAVLLAGRMMFAPASFAGGLFPAQGVPGAGSAAAVRISTLEPDPGIRLTPAEEELARTVKLETDVLLRLKQLCDREIVRLAVEDDQAKAVLLEGIAIPVPAGNADTLVLNLGEELLARGLVLFVDELNYGNGDDRVGLIRSADPLDVLRLKRTDGANYDHTAEDVLARVRDWRGRYPLTIVGAGRDWVDIKFKEPPADVAAFSQEVYEFCPDTVDQGVQSVENLAAAIKESGRLFLWWD